MVISNIKSSRFLFLIFLFIIFSCKKNRNSNVPLYLFNEKINFKKYDSLSIKSAVVEFKKGNSKVVGKIIYTKEEPHFGYIKFESIYDTIKKNDSIIITINKQKNYFTQIEQKYVKVSHGVRPAFIEYKLNGIKVREGNGVIRQE